jgi:nucleoside-diphosphate-sugar epimerase
MATKSSPIVLVTGINGYIASATVLAALNAGYQVRGTVRSLERDRDIIATAFPSYLNVGTLEIVEIPDSSAPGAFDEVVKGVCGILSVAAPGAKDLTDVKRVVKEGVAGITSLLQSAEAHAGPSLKAVSLLSSGVTMLYLKPPVPNYTYTEKDNAPENEALALQMGDKAPKDLVYIALKIAIERTFWEFINNPKRKSTFTGTSINPSYCIGPAVVLPKDPMILPGSCRWVWYVFAGSVWPKEPPFPPYVDVRDVARALVFGVESPDKAGGKRLLVTAYKGSFQTGANILHEAFPDRKEIMRKGVPEDGLSPPYQFDEGELKFDGSNFERLSEQKYTPFPKSMIDTAASFQPWIDQGLDKGLSEEVPLLY